ncbi:MAG: Hsp20 family protein [Candidatus Lokiarchaeota archaeon]|nr:Hsp20 family protein [Candidatus Lokiarchaeota archaeon]
MSLIRKPKRLFNLDRFFDDFLFEPISMDIDYSMPKMDIKEYDDKYDVLVEVPGFDKEDIEIEINNNILTIKSEKKTKKEEEDEEGNYVYRERSYMNFSRKLRLPENVHSDDIKASMEKGVLKVELHKGEVEPKKKIEISETKEPKEKEESEDKEKVKIKDE